MPKRRKNSTHRKSKRQPSLKKCDTKFIHALKKLKQLKPLHRTQAMRMANNTFIRRMCSEIRKVRYKDISPKKAKPLKRYRKTLQKLSNNKTSLVTKRKLLSQRGGFLGALIPTLLGGIVAPAIGKLVGSLTRR